MRLIFQKQFIIVFLILIFVTTGLTQISDKIINIEISPTIENQQVIINASLVSSQIFSSVELAYRTYGQSEFKRLEMNIIGNNAIGKIPADQVIPPFIDYYLILNLQDTEEPETYPQENPVDNPLKLTIKPKDENYDITWISPEFENKIEDLLIAFSVFGIDTSVDFSATKIFINDDDITSISVRSEDLFVVKPENFQKELKTGEHQIRVELYLKDGKKVKIEKRDFIITSAFPIRDIKISSLKYKGSIQLETRNENISGVSNTYNRGNFSANSEFGILQVHGRVYATNEEKSDRQPQNRFFIGAEIPWLKIGYGDSYPSFPNLIMSGKRIRGVSTNLSLKFFNLDAAYGEINRKIDSRITEVSFASVGRDTNKIYFQIDKDRWAILQKRGVFKRDLLVVRPSFGSGKNFQLGINFLKSKDDINSIKYGLSPQENLVVGSDLMLSFDNRRIEINGQAAFSATNKDISEGTISNEDIDSLFKTMSDAERDLIHSIKDIASRFITVNKNLVPLSLKNLTTLAYEGAINLNYFNNVLSFTYLRRGGSYESFGQTYIRTDVEGFNIIDRIRLMKNSLLLSFGLEQLQDNTTKTKAATTKYNTYNTTVSYYPNIDFPSFSIGFTHSSTTNKLPHDFRAATDDKSIRYFIQSGYNFFFHARHNVVVNFSNSSRDDQTIRNFDTKNFSTTIGLNTYYKIPLQTSLSFSTFTNKFVKSTSDTTSIISDVSYTTIALAANYRLMKNKLQLNGVFRPTFGDIERGFYEISIQYELFSNLFASTQVSIFSPKSSKTEHIWNLTIRYGF
ncbi:MAG: hypothetical protein QME25_00375 [Bacteroidota bacterium]|nr:hypothetical protein [Bacteroidota bacterium]